MVKWNIFLPAIIVVILAALMIATQSPKTYQTADTKATAAPSPTPTVSASTTAAEVAGLATQDLTQEASFELTFPEDDTDLFATDETSLAEIDQAFNAAQDEL